MQNSGAAGGVNGVSEGGAGGRESSQFTGWQNPQRDYESRRQMISSIVRLLRNRKPDAPDEWLRKLPDMARRLEDKLYRFAQTQQEYVDPTTLKRRLQMIAQMMSSNQGAMRPSAGGGGGGMNSQGNYRMSQMAPQQQQFHSSSNQLQRMPSQSSGYAPNQSKGGMPTSQMNPSSNSGSGGNASSSARSATPRQKEMVLRQQQQRLLLLRHASKCPAQRGRCHATSHCGQMKDLWTHIATCKDQQCQVPHCVSSRYVLSHYHRCQDNRCAVCGPVREAIHRHQNVNGNQTSSHPGQSGPMHPNMGPDSSSARSHPAGRGSSQSAGAAPAPPLTGQGRGVPRPGMNQGGMSNMGGMSNTMDHDLNPAMPMTPGMDPHRQELIKQQLRQIQEQEEALKREESERQRKKEMLEQQKRRMLQAMQSGGAVPIPPAGSPYDPMAMPPVGHINPSMSRVNSSASLSAMPPDPLAGPAGKRGKAAKAAPGRKPTAKAKKAAADKAAGKKGKGKGGRSPAPGQLKRAGSQSTIGSEPANKRRAKAGTPPAGPRQAVQAPGKPGAVANSNAAEQRQQHAALSSTTSLINTFTRQEMEEHIQSLAAHTAQMRALDLKSKASQLLKKLAEQKFYWVFKSPVDPVSLNLADYFDVIKHPMDLGTVKKKLDGNAYHTLTDFANDVRLTFNNAILYNVEGSEVNTVAKEYGLLFEAEYNKLLEQTMQEEALKRTAQESCRLCGEVQLSFEPQVYYCSGKCNAKIRRNAQFYATPDNKMFWCQNCYTTCLKDTVATEEGGKIKKSDLIKHKNQEVVHEGWVHCDKCNRWYHQICALFNEKKNARTGQDDPYHCPFCVLRSLDTWRLNRLPVTLQPRSRHRAKDLPTTVFSNYLEERVARRVEQVRKQRAIDKGLSIHDIEKPGEINIRVVACTDTEVVTRTNLERLYKGAPFNYPSNFPFRLKCVLVFEKLQGVDTLLFGLYVQSYGSNSPQPNHRCLYIAYLDSVFYFQPRFIRTPVYQELLIGVLDYEKRRGHTKAFIWACPPIAGDDYILYCHPKDQKTPKSEMLRNWYLRLLEDARKEGVVCSLDNLYDAYFARLPNCMAIPNFEGDYWPGVTEQMIEELENGKVDPKSIIQRPSGRGGRSKNGGKVNKGTSQKKKTSKKSKKSKARKKNAAAANAGKGKGAGVGDDEEEDESKKKWTSPYPLPLDEVPRHDALAVKVAEYIQPMKEDFIVVYMHHNCVACSTALDQPDMVYWLPENFNPAEEEQDHTQRRYAGPYCLCNDCYVKEHIAQFGKAPTRELPPPLFPDFIPGAPGLDAKAKDADAAREAAKKLDTLDTSAEAIRYGGATNFINAVGRAVSEANGGGSKTDKKVKKESDAKNDVTEKKEDDAPKDAAATTAAAAASTTTDAAVKVEQVKTEETVANVQDIKKEETESKETETESKASEVPVSTKEEEKPAIKKEEETVATNTAEAKDNAQPTIETSKVDENATDPNASTSGPTVATDAPTSSKPSKEKANVAPPPPPPEGVRLLPVGQAAKIPNAYLEPPCTLLEMTPHRANIQPVTKDEDEIMSCEFFDTRQQFLSLCQGNRYQFDQLRRAKHSSMMVLYHLHNPNLPAYTHSCNSCRADIDSNAIRWTCSKCPDFDLCEKCHTKVQHPHKLKSDKEDAGPAKDGERLARDNRRRNVKLHMQLLVHASTCELEGNQCKSHNCPKMKDLLKHGLECRRRNTEGCKTCDRIMALLHIHARQCQALPGRCRVPRCPDLKEQLRRHRQAQQDRRIRQHQQVQQERRIAAMHANPAATAAAASPVGSVRPMGRGMVGHPSGMSGGVVAKGGVQQPLRYGGKPSVGNSKPTMKH